MTAFLATIAMIVPQHHFEQHQMVEQRNADAAIARQHYDPRRRVVRPFYQKFMRIAWCESTNRWHLSTGNGFYGGIQFTYSSWHAVGGRGYPHWYSKLEQMYRGVLLMRRQGWGAWPVCAYQ